MTTGVSRLVPYDVEKQAKEHGAKYKHALVPFTSYVVQDGNLFTGENPQSAHDLAERMAQALS